MSLAGVWIGPPLDGLAREGIGATPGVNYDGYAMIFADTGKPVYIGGTGGINLLDNVTITGTMTLTGAQAVTGALVVTSAAVAAFAVGPTGSTNAALRVDASTTSSATGLLVKSAAAAAGVALSARSSGTDESMTIDGKGAGNVVLQSVATGGVGIGGAVPTGAKLAIPVAPGASANYGNISMGSGAFDGSTSGFYVGSSSGTQLAINTASTFAGDMINAQNAGNSLFRVRSVSGAATGLGITGAAAAAGLAIAVLSSGNNENLTFDAKGSGTISLGTVSTGNIVLGRATTGVSLSVTGPLTAKSGTATTAAGGGASPVGPAILFSSTAGLGIYWGSGAPTSLVAAAGSLYIRTDGTTNARIYQNTDGSTTWQGLTSS